MSSWFESSAFDGKWWRERPFLGFGAFGGDSDVIGPVVLQLKHENANFAKAAGWPERA